MSVLPAKSNISTNVLYNKESNHAVHYFYRKSPSLSCYVDLCVSLSDAQISLTLYVSASSHEKNSLLIWHVLKDKY